MSHIKEWQIAGFIDKTLDKTEIRTVKRHIQKCNECADMLKSTIEGFSAYKTCEDADTLESVSDGLLQTAKVNVESLFILENESSPDVFDVIIDFANDAGNRIIASLWDFKDSLLMPESNFAIRGDRKTKQRDAGIQLKKKFDKFDLSISVLRMQSNNANITITLSDSTQTDIPEMRVGLFVDDNELDSVALKDGNANFSEISLGNYTMKLWDRSGEKIAVAISMKG